MTKCREKPNDAVSPEREIIDRLSKQNAQLQNMLAEYNSLVRKCIQKLDAMPKSRTEEVKDTKST
ncbi:uncharacterized protein BJX67DRAFT_356705 [Aspergillus lucknowensis]|uniref:DASH complex subunit DAD4 n=1 Tax=Aspergillus lucknowensis TaxID=176173 RepID=A0ABR4LS17_9EURO